MFYKYKKHLGGIMGAKNQFPAISRQNRLKAIEEGSATYVSGTTCKHCNTSVKYVKNSSCVECTTVKTKQRDSTVYSKYIKSKKGQEWLSEYRKTTAYKQVQKRWLDATGYGSLRQSLRRKQIKDSITLLSIDELEQVEQIYKKAAELRQSTGKMFHVDHIIRLADGGTHWPDNLQILDEFTHREKTSGENRKEG